MKNLAPDVYRQRMIIEGLTDRPIKPEEMAALLVQLSNDLDMEPLSAPTTSFCEEFGWCAHMHWKTSGVHMYEWHNRQTPFFSIDIYTCKKFSHSNAVWCVRNFLDDKLIEIAWKAVDAS